MILYKTSTQFNTRLSICVYIFQPLPGVQGIELSSPPREPTLESCAALSNLTEVHLLYSVLVQCCMNVYLGIDTGGVFRH